MHKHEKKYIKSRKKMQEMPRSLADQQEMIGDKLNFASQEAYKLLRTNLIFSMSDENQCKTVGITSALRGEGKSTTAINLAYSLAEAKKNTLLIEADMRLPLVQKVLQFDNPIGLSNVLAGLNKLEEVVQHQVFLDHFSVLPSGEIPPNPSELLSSAKMKKILFSLAEEYDYIIIDLPPISAVSDGLALAKLLSGMLIVVRPDYCDQHALSETIRQLEFLKVKILGFVMNCKGKQKKKSRRYGEKYQYHSSDKKRDLK